MTVTENQIISHFGMKCVDIIFGRWEDTPTQNEWYSVYGIIAFVFGFIHFIEIRVMHDHCETRKTANSKYNNYMSAMLIVCIVIKQSKTHNKIL